MHARILFGLLAVTTALIGCRPVVKDVPLPSQSSILGPGRIVSVQQIVVRNPGASERAGEALLYGGVLGVAGAAITEGDIGRSSLRQYKAVLPDGQTLEVNSFSVATVNDCVTITPLPGANHVIVERVDATRCAAPQP